MENRAKIAVLAAASDPSCAGGAERFYDGLVASLIAKGFDAEVVFTRADESNFNSILENYDQVEALDLSGYDLVISTKAPTFAVRHKNHLLYLVHTIRVFYDMFDDVFPWADEALRQQRQTIQDRDTAAIQEIRHRFTIGHEVSERLRKYNGIQSEILHPPLGLNGFHSGELGNYFFLPGRLHSWKRVDLVINAIKSSSLPLKLLIAGTGEAESDLRAIAANDPRIEFLGRVTDTQLIELYANALAVPFVPVREDYGYVTLEAFASGKAVITCYDSGEPLQFVKHGVTGLVCQPTPSDICAALELMFSNREKTNEWGNFGQKSIEHITWPNVAERLLTAGFPDRATLDHSSESLRRITKVAVLDMQPIEPAVGGGRLRLLGLYHALGDDIQARYVGTYDWPGEKYRQHNITQCLEEIDVPLSAEHYSAANLLARESGGKTVIDIAFPRLCHLSPDYLAKAREAIEWADVVIFSHPWVFPLVANHLKRTQLIVYDSHNVEGFLRAQLLDENNPVETQLLREVVQAEYTLGVRAELVLTCSHEDQNMFAKIYEWPSHKIRIVPNAVMASKITPPDTSGRIYAKQRVGLALNRQAAIFIGSGYQPNVEAAIFIIHKLAPLLPNCDFVIAGGVGEAIDEAKPNNVTVTGFIDDDQKLAWLQAADFAVNPMFSGSGTNIKMFDFMAAGLPVISTQVGARGIVTGGLQPILIADNSAESFRTVILKLLGNPKEARRLSIEARSCVDINYSWEKISPQLGKLLLKWQRGRSDVNKIQKLAHLSTAGHACGVGEYTLSLVEALSAAGIQNYLLTCKTPSATPMQITVPATTAIGWHYDDELYKDSCINTEVVNQLRMWGADYVIVQYHVAFFSGLKLVAFAEECLEKGIRVAVEIHNFTLVDSLSFQRLTSLGCLLIVHSHREVAEASIDQIKATYLPLLVPENKRRVHKSIAGRDLYLEPPVIASVGFIRPHKGLPQLIEALAILRREKFPGSRLKLQCSLFPSLDSKKEYAICLEKIRLHGLEEAVEFATVFLPIEEVYSNLSTADLVVLPYDFSSEGSSAAAGSAIASGVPLLISRSPIFAEHVSAAEVMPDNQPETIAREVAKILDQANKYADLVIRSQSFAQNHSAAAISMRYEMLLDR